MNIAVTWILGIASLAVGLFAAWHTWRGYRFSNPLFWSIAALEAGLIGLAVSAGVSLSRTSREISGGLFISYLITVVLVPPAAVVWGIGEKSRWGTGVLAIALLTVTVLLVRLEQIWRTGA